jgi:hypothetical protein
MKKSNPYITDDEIDIVDFIQDKPFNSTKVFFNFGYFIIGLIFGFFM